MRRYSYAKQRAYPYFLNSFSGLWRPGFAGAREALNLGAAPLDPRKLSASKQVSAMFTRPRDDHCSRHASYDAVRGPCIRADTLDDSRGQLVLGVIRGGRGTLLTGIALAQISRTDLSGESIQVFLGPESPPAPSFESWHPFFVTVRRGQEVACDQRRWRAGGGNGQRRGKG